VWELPSVERERALEEILLRLYAMRDAVAGVRRPA
jgi:hypothetical protein